MPNVRHIAKAAGVSITTVSRVLNHAPGVSEAARQAVLGVVNELRYVPEVGRRSTSNIALVYTDAPTLDSPFDAALLVGMHEAVAKLGCDLLILDAHRSRRTGETFSQMFLRKGVRGALLRTTTSSRPLCEEIIREGVPAVVVGYRLDGDHARSIYSDSREASGRAIDHLLALGHRRIAVCMHLVEDSDHADRLAACRKSMGDHGVAFDERLVIRVPANREGGEQAVRRIAAMANPPTALFLTDPLTSVGALCEARLLGLQVPGDLSIVGFDDTELRHGLVPSMTAVCQNTKELGGEAVRMLGTAASKRAEQRRVRALPCWLEVHDSTAAPRRSIRFRPCRRRIGISTKSNTPITT